MVYANRLCRELMDDPKTQTSLLSTGTMDDDVVALLWLLLWMR